MMRILVFVILALLTGCGARPTNPPGVHSKCGTWAEEPEGAPFHPPPMDYYGSALHSLQAETEGVQKNGSGIRCLKGKYFPDEESVTYGLQAEIILLMERECRHHDGNPVTGKLVYRLSAVNDWTCIKLAAEAVRCDGRGGNTSATQVSGGPW